ncbi:hypothetical protein SAMD00023353_3300010 [Rosellinia necatrix]|uniref:DUF6604 domain-containing protein n=1 Tax=Rosellinia necatrix TaxID=77044 RepID=A0A1W2TKC5_ROSNE|nr:hypothetical protein SAMD00023353_3300010 [Rosellinia necatrix]
MLPDSLYSVYRQYKLDTDAIASWLATTAQANGYPQELLQPGGGDDPHNQKPRAPSRRLKGKARLQAVREHRQSLAADKARQAQKKYTIAVKDFVVLADFISEKRAGVGKVPASFVKTLDRVIRARRAFGDQIDGQGEVTGDKAAPDSAHMYFVGVLEKVRDVMKPLFPSPASSQKQAPQASADGQETQDALTNRFAGLSVYEPSEAFLNMPDVERPQPAKTAGDDELGATYEAERLNAFEDVIFALTALMDDLNRFRERINWIWTAYGQGLFDLCAAAIATNTAIDLARNLMDEITPDLDAHGGAWKMLQKFHMMQCMMEGHGLEALLDNAGSTDNFNYKLYDAGIGQFLQVYNMVDAFSRVIEPNQLPLYKEGMFGTYDPQSNRNAKTGYEKFHEDRALLMPFFTELMTVCVSVTDYPVEDEFLRGMAEMQETRQTPFPMVFAAQVFLDIHHLLRKDVSRAFDAFQSGVTVLRDELEAHLNFHKTLKIDTWPRSNDQYMVNIITDIRTVLRDPVYRAKERYYRRMNYAVPDSVEPNRILRMSPVLSGLVLFKYRAEVRDIAFTVINAWGSVTYTAHLFNALSREKLLSGDGNNDDANARPLWPDMAVIRSLMLEDEQIFVGGAPSNADEYFTRFCLQIGTTVNAFSKRKEKRKGPLASKAGPRGIKPETLSPVTSMFIDRYVRKTGRVNWTTEHVERVIEASQWEAEGSEEDHTLIMGKLTKEELARKKEQEKQEGKKKGESPAEKPAHLTPEELIRSLTLALHNESPEFAFPLLTMHRSCWRLLRVVKQQCDEVLRELFTPAYLERETELPFVVGWVFMAAATFQSLPDKRPMLEAAKAVRREVVLGDGGIAAIRRLGELGFPIKFEADEERFSSWKHERHV